MKRTLLAAALLGSALTLASCGQAAEEPAADAAAGIAGMTISNARMVLAPVAGNPAAIYFDLEYQGDRGVALNRASVKNAKAATFHDYGEYDFKVQMMDMLPLPLKKGTKVSFEPGGKHLMAIEPSPDLKPGATGEATIFVSGGTSQTFPIEIRAAGEDR